MEVIRNEDILDKAVKCGHCKRNTVVVCTVKTIDANNKTIFTDICAGCREKLLGDMYKHINEESFTGDMT